MKVENFTYYASASHSQVRGKESAGKYGEQD